MAGHSVNAKLTDASWAKESYAGDEFACHNCGGSSFENANCGRRNSEKQMPHPVGVTFAPVWLVP